MWLLTDEEIEDCLAGYDADGWNPDTIAKAQAKKIIGQLNPRITPDLKQIVIRLPLYDWESLLKEVEQ